VDSEPHFGTKLKAIRDKKEGFFFRRDVAACGRIAAEKLGFFPRNLAYYAGGMS
jgi:hypothetical protein